MKNISLLLNGLLLILVANLYYQGCSGKKVVSDSLSKIKTDSASTDSAPLRIAYVNQDTILDKYVALKDQKSSLEKRFRDADASLRSKGQRLQQDMAALQQTAQKGTVPPAELQKEEQRLGAQQQSLVAEQQKKEKELGDEMRQINENLNKKVTDILDVLKKQRGYDYVLSYSKQGSNILLVNDKYDITNDVLSELNKK